MASGNVDIDADLMAWIEALADTLAVSDGQRAMLRTAMQGLPSDEARGRENLGFSIFSTLPVAIFEAVGEGSRAPMALPATCALSYLALDVLDDLADGDWPEYWGDLRPAEMELTGTLILSVLVPEAMARMTDDPALLAELGRVHRASLTRMADGQRRDLAAAGSDSWSMTTARAVLTARGPDQASGYARLAAILAGAEPWAAANLARYAHDLTGAVVLWGDLHDLLDPGGGDLRQGKRTVPLAAHVNALPLSERPGFLRRLETARSSEAERDAIRADLKASAAVAAIGTYRQVDMMFARDALEQVQMTEAGRARLSGFIEAVAALG